MTEAEWLQGTWSLVSNEFRGRVTYEEASGLEPPTLSLSGHRYRLTLKERVIVESDFRIDPGAHPKHFDLVELFEDGHEWIVRGIYRLENDLLTICLGHERPDEFCSHADIEQSVAVYRRLVDGCGAMNCTNPFSLVAVDPSWLTSTVVALARQMYDSRDFSLMPILADALQDAGCANEDVLNHCVRSVG